MIDFQFFSPACVLTAGEIAEMTGSELVDLSSAAVPISGIASAQDAREGDLCFVDGRKNEHLASSTRASAVLCSADIAAAVRPGVAAIIARKPQWAFALVGQKLYPSAAKPASMTGETGVSSRAYVAHSARLEADVIVEAGAVIGEGVEVGRDTLIGPNSVIGAGVKIGRNCYVGPGASVQAAHIGNCVFIHGGARIGQDGFGYIPGPRGAEKMPQIGRVIIQDNVEIGANTTIDRGALSDTVIGEGSKIDNLVQIAHNVRIGRHCLIASHCGISGSTVLGDGVMLGGRVGLADHLNIGSGVQLGASSGVMNDIPAGEKWMGTPAVPFREFFRSFSAIKRLGEQKKERGRDE